MQSPDFATYYKWFLTTLKSGSSELIAVQAISRQAIWTNVKIICNYNGFFPLLDNKLFSMLDKVQTHCLLTLSAFHTFEAVQDASPLQRMLIPGCFE